MKPCLVIAIPSVRKDASHDIILHKMPIDYGNAESIQEKEKVHQRMMDWLFSMYCVEIWAVGKEPLFYIEADSRMNEEGFKIEEIEEEEVEW